MERYFFMLRCSREMENDILLKLQQIPGYAEGHTIAMPMCSVCKNRQMKSCKIYGNRPDNITKKYEICSKAILDETSPFYKRYMELYGYRHTKND